MMGHGVRFSKATLFFQTNFNGRRCALGALKLDVRVVAPW
jgi:hypothetical protein